MALPELAQPDGTPAFLLAGHGFLAVPVYADVPMCSGSARKRRLFLTAPRVVDVSWLLEADQMAAVDAWFEGALQVGARQFAARVAAEGGGTAWWAAEWLTPYSEDAMHLGRWRVTAKLLLTGEPSESAPELTGFEAEVAIALTTAGRLNVMSAFAAEVEIALIGSTRFAAEIEVALTN